MLSLAQYLASTFFACSQTDLHFFFLFGSGVLESIFSSPAVKEAGSSGGVVTDWDIMHPCPCIVHPLTPNFYIVELASSKTKIVGTRNEYPQFMF